VCTCVWSLLFGEITYALSIKKRESTSTLTVCLVSRFVCADLHISLVSMILLKILDVFVIR